jgi:hypothetical protein
MASSIAARLAARSGSTTFFFCLWVGVGPILRYQLRANYSNREEPNGYRGEEKLLHLRVLLSLRFQ